MAAGGLFARPAVLGGRNSAPQPVGALIAYLAVEEIGGLLPVSFAFAARAMLVLIALEMLPSAYARERVAPPGEQQAGLWRPADARPQRGSRGIAMRCSSR